MSLMDAPDYDPRRDNRNRNIVIGLGATVLLLLVLSFVGFVSGNGWLFTNVPAKHRVNAFFNALEAKDYAKAYDIYENGHPDSGYALNRFTEDWTTFSPVKGPITQHHVGVSATDGKGFWGTGIIVWVKVNGDHDVFMYVSKVDGTMTWPAPHILVKG
jgi:hypothetical protein